MLDNQKNAELDQMVASLREVVSRLAWGLYQGLKEQGFTDAQAIHMCSEFVVNWRRCNG